jgi:hypothetical protein
VLKRIGIRGALLGLVVAVAVGTFAWGAIPNSVSQQITACYPNSGPDKGILRVIDAQGGATCAAGETTISWQQKGMRFMGAYNGATPYRQNDVVISGGRAFVRITTSNTAGIPVTNATNWTALSSGTAECGGFPHPGINWTKAGSTPGFGCDLHGANLANANLSSANLTHANFNAANLTGVRFISANMTGVFLSAANAYQAVLVNANLTGANLLNSNLTSALLNGAILNSANMTNATFVSADVTGADMTSANLTGATFAFTAGTDSVIWSATTCPDGSNSDDNGGTCVGFGI